MKDFINYYSDHLIPFLPKYNILFVTFHPTYSNNIYTKFPTYIIRLMPEHMKIFSSYRLHFLILFFLHII